MAPVYFHAGFGMRRPTHNLTATLIVSALLPAIVAGGLCLIGAMS